LKFFAKTFLVLLVVIFLIHCGGEKKDDKGVVNNPPVANEVTLLPQNPTIRSEITARILSSDKNGDPITYKIKWFVNGKEIGEGMSFTYEEVKKGDKIFAEVTPYDSKDWGKPVKSSEIIIGGLPPKILSLQIAPESLFVTTPQVVITALAEDADKDSLRMIVHWLVNNQVISDTSNTLELRKFGLKKNDVITGSASVDDGEFRSEPFAFELVIANAPPVFKTQVDSVKSPPDSIYYPLPIIDPDGDQLTFEILDAPEGIQIDQNKGIIYGAVDETATFEIMVRATDTDGAYLDAQFTLTSP
jgi:hypothetical protein